MEMQVFPTKPLYRPDQEREMADNIKALEAKLQNKHIEDKAEVSRQLRQARRDFEGQVARPPENSGEEDAMVKRSRFLLEKIRRGMPSQEEMRKNPPGAVEKHMAWERRNKRDIMEWRHIMRRLTAGSGSNDAANLELHRPVASTLSMDNAQIPGKAIYLPDNPDGLGVTFTDAQLDLLRKLSPEIADQIGSMSNRDRAMVKEAMEGIGLETPSPASVAGKKGMEKKRRMMSEAQKAALAEGRRKARERKEQSQPGETKE